MSDKELLDLCNKHLNYNPKTGVFTRKYRSANCVKKGDIAGFKNKDGYVIIKMKLKAYKAHRLAFLMRNKYLPEFVDHKDTIKHHNWESNLRAATNAQNCMNCGLRKDNTSGYKGVHFHKINKKWMAYINIDKKRLSLGYFSCKHKAARVYNTAARMYHGEFAYTNDIKVISSQF